MNLKTEVKRLRENLQTEIQRERNIKNRKVSKACINIKWSNICVSGGPEGEVIEFKEEEICSINNREFNNIDEIHQH